MYLDFITFKEFETFLDVLQVRCSLALSMRASSFYLKVSSQALTDMSNKDLSQNHMSKDKTKDTREKINKSIENKITLVEYQKNNNLLRDNNLSILTC